MRRISTRLILSFLVFLLFSSKCLCSIYTTLISVVRYLHISSFFLSLLARNRPRIIISRKNNLGILKVAICFFFKISLRLKMSYRNFYQAVLPKLHFFVDDKLKNNDKDCKCFVFVPNKNSSFNSGIQL